METVQEASTAARPAALISSLFNEIGRGNKEALRTLYSLTACDLYAEALCWTGSNKIAEDVLVCTYIGLWRQPSPGNGVRTLHDLKRLVRRNAFNWLLRENAG